MKHRIAIIGAGSAGSLTALRLRQHLPEAEIVVFERENRVGGRACTVPFAGEIVEVGGTLLHSSNKRLVDLAAQLGLEYGQAEVALGDVESSVAVWNGERFLLRASTKGSAFMRALVLRYGPLSLLRLKRLATEAVNKWLTIYDLQDSGTVFTSVPEVVAATGLTAETKVSLRTLAASRRISRRLVDEFATGILRNMYNQTPDINAFAGTIGLAGAGLAGGSLFSIAAGNHALFEGALKLAQADLRLGTAVTEVTTSRDVITSAGSAGAFDAVVLAAPMELAGVTGISGATDDGYQTVHVTLVAGQVNPEYFGVTEVPGTIFTTPSSARFKSLGRVGHSQSLNLSIFKFFSADALDDDFLQQVFSVVADTHRLVWSAYPVMTVDPTLHEFRVSPGVYTVNVSEAIGSTLETEAVAGWSVADLVAHDLNTAELVHTDHVNTHLQNTDEARSSQG